MFVRSLVSDRRHVGRDALVKVALIGGRSRGEVGRRSLVVVMMRVGCKIGEGRRTGSRSARLDRTGLLTPEGGHGGEVVEARFPGGRQEEGTATDQGRGVASVASRQSRRRTLESRRCRRRSVEASLAGDGPVADEPLRTHARVFVFVYVCVCVRGSVRR